MHGFLNKKETDESRIVIRQWVHPVWSFVRRKHVPP